MQASGRIVIVDYGTSNVQAVYRRLRQIGVVTCIISNDPADVISCDKLILPGVGHFNYAMRDLAARGVVDALHEAVLVRCKPVLGICLGMQLMAESSEEGGRQTAGLAWIRGTVRPLIVSDEYRYKVPHIGWNSAGLQYSHPLIEGIDAETNYYFTHSYHLAASDDADVLQRTDYGGSFVSAIVKDNIMGVQYHPEKSYDAGLRLLKNFTAL